MEVTSFTVFIILLSILVISVLLWRKFGKETFINFQFSKQPQDYVWIPQYSSNSAQLTVVKLVDNLFFDTKNGNLIEVNEESNDTTQGNAFPAICSGFGWTDPDPAANGRTFSCSLSMPGVYQEAPGGYCPGNLINVNGNCVTTSTPKTESVINKITITDRSNSTPSVYNFTGNVVATDTKESLIKSITNSSKEFVSVSTSNYATVYIPWHDRTYLHIINTAKKSSIGTFFFEGPSIMSKSMKDLKLSMTDSHIENDINDGTNVTDLYYDPFRRVKQITNSVKFDTINGKLIIQENVSGNKKRLRIFDRDGKERTSSSETTKKRTGMKPEKVPFMSHTFMIESDQLILYIVHEIDTVIAVINFKSGRISYVTVSRFLGSEASKKRTNKKPVSNKKRRSEDYILKTKIIPPIGGACPTCVSSGSSCPSCSSSSSNVTPAPTMMNGTPAIPISATVNSSVSMMNGTPAIPISAKGNSSVSMMNGTSITTRPTMMNGTSITTRPTMMNGTSITTRPTMMNGTSVTTRPTMMNGTSVTPISAKGNSSVTTLNGTSVTPTPTASVISSAPFAMPQPTKSAINQRSSTYGGTNNQPATDQFNYYGALQDKVSSDFLPVTADFSSFGK